MPQESLRSVVYKSFVTCEDPRGVVEGKTIRISKTGPTNMSTRRTEKEKEKMSLVEVKNGAQNLHEAIDLWSKGVSFKTQPKDIAKDLLKGALDLQESLMMLGKLQEVSCLANFKRKQEKPSEEPFSRIGSDRFESFEIYDSGYEKERKLANGSSRDCFTELREVIIEGLSKQNLLPPNKSYQESSFSSTNIEGTRKPQLSPDIASTSSSTSSSMVHSTHEFTSFDSFSSRATDEKSKGSNVIAKLMGLEEFPAKPPRKQLDITSKMRPVYDVDLPNAKKPQFSVQKSDREHMPLDEIVKMMQSKGLLRTNKRDMKRTSKRFEDDASPIVLMRPQRVGSYPDHLKVKVHENPIRKLHQEKAKTEAKSVKNRKTSKSKLDSRSNKQKASVPAAAKPQRNQEVEKKIDKIQKMTSQNKKKSVDNAKSTNSMSKNSSLKPQISAQPNQVSKRTTIKSNNQKKNTKIEKPIIIHEALQIDSPNQEQTKDSEVTVKEIDNVRQETLCEAARDDTTRIDQSETRNNQEHEGVSDTNKRNARILKTITTSLDPEPASFELFQDCITEFLDHENERQNPLTPKTILPSRVYVSEDETTREILKRFERLRSYSKFSTKSCGADTVSGLLERDLRLCIGGAWGTTGWKDGCTVTEVEEIVLDMEKMVLSGLIDDLVMELV
ncbi:hypothetical protein HanPI659440_Chr10g0398721 [Helianthus annuus]|nr:hypothetical protein HanPI659440_Chr10g0398721 [Helianthus annuus]